MKTMMKMEEVGAVIRSYQEGRICAHTLTGRLFDLMETMTDHSECQKEESVAKQPTKYDFDLMEMEGQDILLVVAKAAEDCGGLVTGFERVGPGGGNANFRVEVMYAEKFDEWLRDLGFGDPEEYRA